MSTAPAAAADVDHALLAERAWRIRRHVVEMCAGPEGGHLGGSMSLVEILVALYFVVLQGDPAAPPAERDCVVLSKGHAAIGWYAALAERGMLPVDELVTFGLPGSRLMGHPVRDVPGVDLPSGSLGHGLALGAGLALAARHDDRPWRRFVLLGDGELQEGSVWEAALAAAALGLDNLVAIVDRNGLQITGPTEQVVGVDPVADKWRAFGWAVREVDGHDLPALLAVLGALPAEPGRPTAVVARTVKGRSLPYVEGRVESHFARLGERQHQRAVAVLESQRPDTRRLGEA